MKYTVECGSGNYWLLVSEGPDRAGIFFKNVVFSSLHEMFIRHLAESLNYAVERLEEKNKAAAFESCGNYWSWSKEEKDAGVSEKESDR